MKCEYHYLLLMHLICRFVRFIQAKGFEEFRVDLSSCSYASSVPFEFRKEGVLGTCCMTHTNFS